MTTKDRFANLQRLLAQEELSAAVVAKTPETAALNSSRSDLLKHVREVGKSNDLAFIVATEKIIVLGDLERYANSPGMVTNLKKALDELETVERHLPMVDDASQYRLLDATHRFLRNRKGGLPWDEARQALGSHYTRLDNLDKIPLVR
ncbi:hypothetical protein AGMMS50256_38080 [Betaproteobacteria bacterium]|nr:hypothetical protein AGMMS50256_38080 [Betaproteobacteria bacterium]